MMARAGEHGFRGVLAKPFSLGEVARVARSVIHPDGDRGSDLP